MLVQHFGNAKTLLHCAVHMDWCFLKAMSNKVFQWFHWKKNLTNYGKKIIKTSLAVFTRYHSNEGVQAHFTLIKMPVLAFKKKLCNKLYWSMLFIEKNKIKQSSIKEVQPTMTIICKIKHFIHFTKTGWLSPML